MKHMMLKASCGTLFLLCSQAALAHHATPTAQMVCDRDTGDWNIEYTATTWENCDILGFGGVESCGNPDIGIFFYDNESDATSLIEPTAGTPAAGNGVLAEAVGSSFSGSALSPTQTPGDVVWVAAKPLAKWGDNRTYAAVNPTLITDYRRTSVAVPDEPCDEPNPGIELVKEVSVDGGTTFFDANDAASAPTTLVGGDALYQITVTNTGDVDLENVVVNDGTLGIVNYPVGDLAVGVTVVLDANAIPELFWEDACTEAGLVTNIADVSGDPVFGTGPVTDDDPANVNCDAPELGCWFTGGQNIQINRVRGRPEHSGGGNIYPSCSALPGDCGQWTHTDHDQELPFQARSLTGVECGNVPEIPPGAPSPAVTVNYIKATAVGIIKGIGGNDLEETEATAVLIMEDWGEPGRDDKYTIEAMGGGAVISLDRAPLVNGGNFQIHQSSCDN